VFFNCLLHLARFFYVYLSDYICVIDLIVLINLTVRLDPELFVFQPEYFYDRAPVYGPEAIHHPIHLAGKALYLDDNFCSSLFTGRYGAEESSQ
jgi:hypothetical protein